MSARILGENNNMTRSLRPAGNKRPHARATGRNPIMIRACLFQDPLYLYRKGQIVWSMREQDQRSMAWGFLLSFRGIDSLALAGSFWRRRTPSPASGRSGLLRKPGLLFPLTFLVKLAGKYPSVLLAKFTVRT